ncbi:MAG: recombinase family protein [Actinobacteria bacterium]|nr:recombinase family protein [Actinomycetota bacterium]
MRDDELPRYDATEQGVTDDHETIQESSVAHQRRIERNRDVRNQLIQQLNTGARAIAAPPGTPAAHAASADPAPHTPRAALYLRVSTEEQAHKGGEAEGYSLPTQRDACRHKAQDLTAIVIEEYVEAGDSARSANRPELQRLLRDVKHKRYDYVIVHKIDRWARWKEDDVLLTAALARVGTELISASEHFDDTPGGRFHRNIMADVAQYHSDNLAVEVLKGMDKKAEKGGTPFRAPLGYLNRREIDEVGADIRTVITDPERAPLIRWALQEYATGNWAGRALMDALTRKGLTTRPTRHKPGEPIAMTTFYRMLSNPYYMGTVCYHGIYYEGSHEPLIDPETWLRIQDVLRAHYLAGEKERIHHHYLKGTIFCGECGTRMVFSRNKGNGGTYEYYLCLSRKTKRRPCSRTVIRLDAIEAAITRFYHGFQLSPQRAAAIRTAVHTELQHEQTQAEQDQKRARSRVATLHDQRSKLLTAHYDGAVPLDMLKAEMTRLTRDKADTERELATASATLTDLTGQLERALSVASNCNRHYATAPPRIRRQINQGFFKALYLHRDGDIQHVELTEPFAQLLADDLPTTASAREAPPRTAEVGG